MNETVDQFTGAMNRTKEMKATQEENNSGMSANVVCQFVGLEDTLAIPRNTKRTPVTTIPICNNGVFFKHLQQPVELLMNVTNAIPGKAQAGTTINELHSIYNRKNNE